MLPRRRFDTPHFDSLLIDGVFFFQWRASPTPLDFQWLARLVCDAYRARGAPVDLLTVIPAAGVRPDAETRAAMAEFARVARPYVAHAHLVVGACDGAQTMVVTSLMMATWNVFVHATAADALRAAGMDAERWLVRASQQGVDLA